MMAKLNDFVPAEHPLRAIETIVNQALAGLNDRFNEIYADGGRASVAPEKLMRALLLQVFYSIRSERQVCEQLRYNLLFRRFVGLAMDDAVSDHSTFSKNRDRLLEHEVIEAFFTQVMQLADAKGLLSELARRFRLETGWVCEVLRMTRLAPDIIRAILDGRQPWHLILHAVRGRQAEVPLDWQEQRKLFGFIES